MRALRLPNGNLIVLAEPDDLSQADGLAEIGPDHLEYGKGLIFVNRKQESVKWLPQKR